MAYVCDTCVFDWLVDERIDTTDLPTDDDIVITHIQVDEINRIPDEERRARVLLRLASLSRGVLPTETLVLDVSRLGQAKLGDGELYSSIRAILDEANGGRDSNIRDALIAETAIANRHTLLTADRDLAAAARAHGGEVTLFEAPRATA